jgi:hypothetical protein
VGIPRRGAARLGFSALATAYLDGCFLGGVIRLDGAGSPGRLASPLWPTSRSPPRSRRRLASPSWPTSRSPPRSRRRVPPAMEEKPTRTCLRRRRYGGWSCWCCRHWAGGCTPSRPSPTWSSSSRMQPRAGDTASSLGSRGGGWGTGLATIEIFFLMDGNCW